MIEISKFNNKKYNITKLKYFNTIMPENTICHILYRNMKYA